MCCCIPLRRLSYLGAICHMGLGLLYLYYLGSVAYSLYDLRTKEKSKVRLVMGLLYMAYYAAFLPPGIFIFWGVHKKIRCYLVAPSVAFVLVMAYGIGLESYFGFRPQWLPEAIRKYNSVAELNKLRAGFWMDILQQIALTVVYLFMLFFYYREIGPESLPPQSRYAQAYNQQQSQYPQHQQQQLQLQHNQPHQQIHTHLQLHQHQQHQQQGHQHQHQLPPVLPFRPVALPSQQGPQGGSLAASNTNLNRNSTPCPPNSISLAGLANSLTYEQQQQLLKLQQHPVILQQQLQAHLQQQLQQQQQHHHHSHHREHRGDREDQMHPLFHSQYVHMLSSQDPGSKTPKF